MGFKLRNDDDENNVKIDIFDLRICKLQFKMYMKYSTVYREQKETM